MPVNWSGLDYNERVASNLHNKLVGIVLDGMGSRGAEHLDEARRVIARLESERFPGRQNTAAARRWGHTMSSLRRLLNEAEEVAIGTRAPKLGRKGF